MNTFIYAAEHSFSTTLLSKTLLNIHVFTEAVIERQHKLGSRYVKIQTHRKLERKSVAELFY